MTPVERVVGEASRTVVPDEGAQRRASEVAEFVLARTRRAALRHREVRGVVLGGSFAKGTWLPENADIDVFVKFDVSTPAEKFERLGLEVGARAMQGYPRGKKYAQHPYTEATLRGFKVNVVPCYAVKARGWRSAADRSPFHVGLVKRLPDEKKTEVRLLKRFMVSVGVYGAEIETRGFSGYVAEVLVMKHGSFVGVVRAFADFSPAGSNRVFSLGDPVDQSRDLGIAVSGEKLGRFVLACREFLKRPSVAYFERVVGVVRPSMSRYVIAVVFSHKRLSEDVLWGELRRTMKNLVKQVEVRGFKVARALAASDDERSSAFIIIPEFGALPLLEQRVGPSVDLQEETKSFISSNRKAAMLVWVDDDARVRLLQKREYTSLTGLLEDLVRGRAGPTGASAEVGRGLATSSKVLTGRRLSSFAARNQWMREGIREIVSDTIGTRGP